ncbi:sentrin-specific protease 1-like [Acyrthosiphon pisum]|uniref:Ubiquitin-like protease family profile domain-containing protein n=1 Tax=Acyrthosiphon pisum TaxID=7029 RepID=A0A8R2JLA7_ACYPI|nr:sentrin-specific protease 1-like [Acyrthosiphon pisum]
MEHCHSNKDLIVLSSFYIYLNVVGKTYTLTEFKSMYKDEPKRIISFEKIEEIGNSRKWYNDKDMYDEPKCVFKFQEIEEIGNSRRWFTDNDINRYMDLITQRSPDTVYAFNTFFYTKLCDINNKSVHRWTKQIDIFAKKILFIPIHMENHWCLVCVCFQQKSIQYYDSFGAKNSISMQRILKYLEKELRDKKRQYFDRDGWELINVNNCPRQTNNWDCGVYICMYAEYISRGAQLNFSQLTMNEFRIQIALEMKYKKLMKPVPFKMLI